MAERRRWTREAILNLGRPLNRWDCCPTCGAVPSKHTYRVDTDTLICPEQFEAVDGETWARQAAETERRLLAEVERTERRTEALRRQLKNGTNQNARMETTIAREGPRIRPGAPRSYFDE